MLFGYRILDAADLPTLHTLFPVAISIGAGSEQRASIAVTIIGGQPTHGPYIGIHCETAPRPLRFLRDILAVASWRTDTVQTHSRIVDPRLFVVPKLDAFEGTFAEEADHVVLSPG